MLSPGMSRKTSLHAKFERQQTPANFGSKVAASSKPKKEKASKAGAIGGFGSGGKLPKGVKVVRDKATTRFLKELASKGGSSVAKTLKRAGLATFATQEYGLLRGVVATADVKKGEPIIEIPYEVAVDLGKEGMGVAEAGARLLKAEIWEVRILRCILPLFSLLLHPNTTTPLTFSVGVRGHAAPTRLFRCPGL